MKTNIGTFDRILRATVAVGIGILYFTDHLSGTAALMLGLGSMIFVLTSFVGCCPAYGVSNISTQQSSPSAEGVQ
jgi:hypothetical protein